MLEVENLEEKNARKEQEKETRKKYRIEMKKYEKLGALKFQKFVFLIEKFKFRLLKKMPNFIKHFDKYLDRKRNKVIKKVSRKKERRKKLEKHPFLLKYYDKFNNKRNNITTNLSQMHSGRMNKLKTNHPKWYEFYDKFLKMDNPYKGLNDEEKIFKVNEINKFSKMFMRKEYYQEKNINYHKDANKPTEIYKYLEWNKKVHVRGLLINLSIIPILLIGTILNPHLAIPLLIIELLSAGINFECINIQNYNICRYKITEKLLKKQEKRKTSEIIDNYGEATKLIYESINQQENLPSFNEIIEKTNDINQIKQLKGLLLEYQKDRIVEMNRGNIK